MSDGELAVNDRETIPGPVEPSIPDAKRKTWRTEDLLGGECEATIMHRGQEYRLRCTKQGKLILFK